MNKIVPLEVKEQYINKINEIILDTASTISAINKALLKYGAIYHNFTQGRYALDFKNSEKGRLLGEAKNSYLDYLNGCIMGFEELKGTYIKEHKNVTSTTDLVELDLTARELEVMDTKGLEEFYEINYSDTNKMRLFNTEIKKRENAGQRFAFNKVEYKDEVTELIDDMIKKYLAYRSVRDMTIYVPIVGEDNAIRFLDGKWKYVDRQVELDNTKTVKRVSLLNYIN